MAINQPAPRPNMEPKPGGRGRVQLLYREKLQAGDQAGAKLVRQIAELLAPDLDVRAHAPAEMSRAADQADAQEKHDADMAAYKAIVDPDQDRAGISAGGR